MYISTGTHKGQRLERTANSYYSHAADIKLFTYNSADFQACYLAKNANIESSWIASEIPYSGKLSKDKTFAKMRK